MANILLIEPDRKLAEVFSHALKSHSHRVSVCADAQSAIMTADEKRPDIVVMELQLVGHSGIEFLYEFRSYVDWHKIPAIIHSHVPQAEFRGAEHMLDRLGVRAYHYKPRTSLVQLLASIENVMSQQILDLARAA